MAFGVTRRTRRVKFDAWNSLAKGERFLNIYAVVPWVYVKISTVNRPQKVTYKANGYQRQLTA